MKKLSVPENIPLRWELWRGFGLDASIRTGLILLIVIGLCVTGCIITGKEEAKVISVAIVIFTAFFCAGFFGRLDQNQSIYEYLKRWKRFCTEQQVFRFKQKDEVIQFVQEGKD